MSQRRMFSSQIVESEEFLIMPSTSQSLYFHLGMNADDDGFIQPKITMRTTGANEDDLKVLLAKRFLLEFDGGVVVIKHWLIHNLIQKDRYRPTRFQEQKKMIYVKENKAYTDDINSVNKMLTQVRLGKVRLGKVRLGKEKEVFFENNLITGDKYKPDNTPPKKKKANLSELQLDFIVRSKLIPIFKAEVNDKLGKEYFCEEDEEEDFIKENSRYNAQIKNFWIKCKRDIKTAEEVIKWFAGKYGEWKNWSPAYCFRKETVIDWKNREKKKGGVYKI